MKTVQVHVPGSDEIGYMFVVPEVQPLCTAELIDDEERY
jgi:hypothetical protein